jgi:hypothetical protein
MEHELIGSVKNFWTNYHDTKRYIQAHPDTSQIVFKLAPMFQDYTIYVDGKGVDMENFKQVLISCISGSKVIKVRKTEYLKVPKAQPTIETADVVESTYDLDA